MAAPLAIGIDIGGTRVRAALVDRSGALHARHETLTAAQAGPQAVVTQIADLVAIVTSGVSQEQLVGAGVCCPGPLDTTRGYALGVPTLAEFIDIPIAEMIAEALGMPLRLENDGVAAAHGEWRFGAGRGHDNLVYVTVSTGVGGGVVTDGRLLHGRKGMAGHVGHMVIAPDGERCSCGARGCWEAYASGTAFARRIAARSGYAGPAAVFAAAGAGEAVALDLVAQQADYLGIGISSLLHLYSPDVVVLGGGVANGLGLMVTAIRTRIEANAMPAFRDVPVVPAGLGENAGLVGAAALMF
ncbi:ROK family protein [Oryzicola mucosus]|uniref:ROK family protein n=1 Tax=Oryzicola mucosus TaxID=2767425 RepID=A0A8J6U7Q4_9HYPH|nr:ROK family protein [Oryzicola mucosus]MBD0415062.1 ROK family protein [Oryzicola mucosus]